MTAAKPAAEPGDDAALVASSRGGDTDAFGRLVRRHQQHVFRLCGRFWRQPADVEDAAQETFLTAWNKLERFSARAPFQHWLTRVCLNCCYGRLRRERRRPDHGEIAREPVAPAADPDAGLELDRLLQALAPADRFLLLLLDGEGWSVAEIAERLGWTRVNVRVRAHRARRKLRALLETSR